MLEMLPPKVKFETIHVLKQLNITNKCLAELKGYASTIPNQNILINAITINEAKDSSAIENIITTHDEVYKAMTISNNTNLEAKEVLNYRTALWRGYELVKKNKMITINMLIEIQELIEHNNAGIRKLPGTVLKNSSTGKVIYTPPVNEEEINSLLSNLEKYINEDTNDIDPLVRMAIIHYQFESIHPFYDGNGRTGRVLNILYLILKNLLDNPIIYLSKYIINTKTKYYKKLQNVSENGEWEEWILYILKGVEQTAKETLLLIKKINTQLEKTKEEIKIKLPKIYSKELVESLFFEFYTKLPYIQNTLKISDKTAASYLKQLEAIGILESEKIGRERIYKNVELFNLIKE